MKNCMIISILKTYAKNGNYNYRWKCRVANPPNFLGMRFAHSHFLGEISIFVGRWRATCQLSQATFSVTFSVFNLKRLHTESVVHFHHINCKRFPSKRTALLKLVYIIHSYVIYNNIKRKECSKMWSFSINLKILDLSTKDLSAKYF